MQQEEAADQSEDITEQMIQSMNEQNKTKLQRTKTQERKNFLLKQINQLENEIDTVEEYVLNSQTLNLELRKKELENNTNEKYLMELQKLEKKRDESILKSKKWMMYLVQNAKKAIDSETEKINEGYQKNVVFFTQLILTQLQEDYLTLAQTGKIDLTSFSKSWEETRIKKKENNSITDTIDPLNSNKKLLGLQQLNKDDKGSNNFELMQKELSKEELQNILEETTNIKTIDVKIVKTTLYYGNLVFKPQEYVYLHTQTENDKRFGALNQIKKNKIEILFPDKSKITILLSQLQTGKFSISKAFEEQN
ncbi:sin3 histone deacetylase corepressor complex component sds3 [Anaeramoeba flamelloides]|uniref:Sin3 histone deacetylase corepressor complex component sds3 n=1 Tax=Anaeramoeba flamelloides TaxID=1746091 RepID=A0AAV7YT16_9EUKA|nr:sin3 histone deacetylase corepressor complex component sds3 [Anaeramoeba flamelloides]